MRSTIRLAPVLLPLLLLSANAQQPGDPIDRIRKRRSRRTCSRWPATTMRGREGGTLDEMTASAWIAERARDAGLQPAGDNGTYFQFFPLERFRVSASSSVDLAGKTLRMGAGRGHRRRGRGPCRCASVTLTHDVLSALVPTRLPASVMKDQVLIVHYVPTPPAADAPAAPAAGPGAGNPRRTWASNVQKLLAAQSPAAVVDRGARR